MNVSWIDRIQKTLDMIKELREKRSQDRLDLVRTMRYGFGALSQSLGGWMQWVNSPEVMSQFTQEELQEMSDTVLDLVTKFVEYDRDITDFGMKKGLGKQREEEPSRFII
jgi:hypothetical protein